MMTATGTSIRNATPADHATVARLFLELGVEGASPSAESFAAGMMGTTLIAERNGTVAGYAFFRPMTDSAHLSQIVTAPEARRAGVGRALMEAVCERARMAGCSTLMLNVLPDNAPAISLYERFGLRRVFARHTLRMDWEIVDALPASRTPHAESAREIEPDDDERVESRTNLPRGRLADRRASGRILRMIEAASDRVALAVFDPALPGVYPLHAPDELHALSLLRALRPLARPDARFFLLVIEDQPALTDALIAEGARWERETLRMQGAL
jgi:ribosomal protein S18 acetylase RimI-like enzyme